jgi:hypothetical protein
MNPVEESANRARLNEAGHNIATSFAVTHRPCCVARCRMESPYFPQNALAGSGPSTAPGFADSGVRMARSLSAGCSRRQ